MTEINPFVTQITKSNDQGNHHIALSGDSTGLFSKGISGLSFIDLIFGTKKENKETSQKDISNSTAISSANSNLEDNIVSLIKTEISKNFLTESNQRLENSNIEHNANPPTDNDTSFIRTNEQKVLFNFLQAIAGTIEEKSLFIQEVRQTNSENIENKIAQIQKIINKLIAGSSENQEEKLLTEEIVQRLKDEIDFLRKKLEQFQNGELPIENITLASFLEIGLIPSKAESLSQRIDEIENKLGRKITIDDLIAGIGQILSPPEKNTELNNYNRLAYFIQKQGLENDNKAPQEFEIINQIIFIPQDINKNLNSKLTEQINTNTGLIFAQNLSQPSQNNDLAYQPNIKVDLATLGKTSIQTQTTEAFIIKLSNNLAAYNIDFSNSNLNFTGDELLSWNNIDTESILTTAQSIQQITNLVTQVSNAGQSHQATQLVSATIQKAIKDGNNQVLNIQLDPPELGRVNVRLEFGSDNSIKAHMLVEKPETYLLLQRDSFILERTLQNAGFDSSNSSLSYQLAEEENAFQQNRNKNSNGNTQGQNTNDQLEILETKMTWNVDPNTGHVHYSILA